MKEEQLQRAENIIGGISFLAAEAELNGLPQMTKILQICIRDLTLSLKNNLGNQNKVLSICNTDMFVALKFLSRYASVKDEDIKKELLQELDKVQQTINKLGACDAASS